MADGNDIPSTYGISDSAGPLLEILSANKALNGVQIDVMFSCFSSLAIDKTPAQTVVSIVYRDECELSTIYPALPQDASVLLY